jgi:hypothetical protein
MMNGIVPVSVISLTIDLIGPIDLWVLSKSTAASP